VVVIANCGLSTVITTAMLVVVCAAELLATTVIECLPLGIVAVLRERLNGAVVTAVPASSPSSCSWTLVVLEETMVEMVMVPETIALEAGEVIDTAGGDDGAKVVLFAPVEPVHPAQRSDRITSRQHGDLSILSPFNLPIGSPLAD